MSNQFSSSNFFSLMPQYTTHATAVDQAKDALKPLRQAYLDAAAATPPVAATTQAAKDAFEAGKEALNAHQEKLSDFLQKHKDVKDPFASVQAKIDYAELGKNLPKATSELSGSALAKITGAGAAATSAIYAGGRAIERSFFPVTQSIKNFGMKEGIIAGAIGTGLALLVRGLMKPAKKEAQTEVRHFSQRAM